MAIDYERELNREQLNVVLSGDGPCLVLAGAGTGKTRAIVYRVARLLEQGVAPERILLVTFTNKAAKEMLRRVEVLLGAAPKGMWGGTFHHVGSRTLRAYGSRIGIAPNYTILDEDDRKGLLQAVMSEYGIDRKSDKYFPKADLVRELISFASNSRRPLPEIIAEWIPKQRDKVGDLMQIAARYEQRKRERAVLDFDDLLAQWLRLLNERPEIRARLSRQFEYILVDEYQDTNRLQGAIVEQLAGTQKNVLVVGDDAQSIYAFRAATVENIMRFPEIFPNARTFRLEQNYRSTQAILDLANASLSGNRRQFKKELRSANSISEHSPSLGAIGRPQLIGCADTIAEVRFIVDRVLEFNAEGESLLDTAVLFRAAYQGMQIELELQKRGVPYIIRGGMRFFEQAHIKDVVAYLKVTANPRDEIAWMRILKLEEGIGDKTAAVIVQRIVHTPSPPPSPTRGEGAIENSPLRPRSEGVRGGGRSEEGLREILNRVAHLKTLSGADKMIVYLLEEFYEKYAGGAFENARERLEDLAQLALFAAQYDALDQFLADATLSEGFRGERSKLSFDENKSSALNGEEYLVLSTIHQAKGLEWKNVFVVGLVDGQFPHYRAQRSREEIEEERRLFYVAVTRAKKRLFLTYPVSQMGSYGMALQQPSLFVRELPPDTYEAELEGEEAVIEVE